jgi:hypothetical protein
MILKDPRSELACTATKFEYASGVLETRMGDKFVYCGVFIEALAVLLFPESVVVSERGRVV